MKEKLASTFGSASSKDWQQHIPRLSNGLPNFQWNHDLVRFPQAIQYAIAADPKRDYPGLDLSKGKDATDIRLFQLDTGWSDHRKLLESDAYLTDQAVNFASSYRTHSKDRLKKFRFPAPQNSGHGISTAHTVIGGPPDPEVILRTRDLSQTTNIFEENLNGGLFPFVKYIPLRIANRVVFNLNRHGRKIGHNIYQAILHAKAQGAHVITMSMGGKFRKKKRSLLQQAVRLAYDSGIIFVCAAGNSRLANTLFEVVDPASFMPETIAVAGIEPFFHSQAQEIRYYPWQKGCAGKAVDISAPAKYIYTAHYSSHTHQQPRREAYRFGGATSQATAHVAAAAAIWRHVFAGELLDVWFQAKASRIVDAFRWGLSKSKYVPDYWPSDPSSKDRSKLANAREHNKGILDVYQLLQQDFSPLKYKESPIYEQWDWSI